jgi:predicted RNase H-like nuclease
MKFLGIDLGWSSGASGLCCLEWQSGKLELRDLRCLCPLEEILLWVEAWVEPQESGVIAVDAPTLIPNATGMRLCDRLTHQHFGRYHAGSYPANLGLAFASRTVEFGRSLEARGFAHAPEIQPQQPGRHQIEVFPHPATIHLFGLPRILKYKKGKLVERRSQLALLRQYILEGLPTLEPPLAALALPELPVKGMALKAAEDQLDSLLCAYVAAHWWYWGQERNWVLGDRANGYIVVPAPLDR